MDGIEIEAYGHLFDQFWSPADQPPRRRVGRLARQPACASRCGCCAAIRERVGAGLHRRHPDGDRRDRRRRHRHQRGARDRCDGSTARGLIDFVNVIRGHIEQRVGADRGDPDPRHAVGAASRLRRRWCASDTGLAVLHASKVDDVAIARHAIREGKVDLVGMTRAQLADPHIVRKIEQGREDEIRPCVGATYCLDRIYAAGEALCIHNAATGPRADDAARDPARRGAARVS